MATLAALFLISCLSYLSGPPYLEFTGHIFHPQELYLLFCCDGYGYPPQVCYSADWFGVYIPIYLLPCVRSFLIYFF